MRSKQYIRLPVGCYSLYREGTDPELRHKQRLDAAHKLLPTMEAFCRKHKISFRYIAENGKEKFIYEKRNRKVDWRPLSATLIIDGNTKVHVHVHDWDGVRLVLQEYLIKRTKGNNRFWFLVKEKNVNNWTD